ncbi:MAG: D-glycero-alpha-D-manno-heptose 1-phosphate guanylyltransferase [Candidatus Omnitrophota bacterium]|jgi:D-glycero-alpha-D-manno-heptose 1-phosphate guanylyltransferase
MEAIILAGGKGERLQGVVKDVPKPMAPIHGQPFLKYILDYFIKQGVSHFVLSVGYKYEVIQNYFKDEYRKIPISYSIEESPLGTGGALAFAERSLKTEEAFMAMNGDTWFEIDLKAMHAEHQMRGSAISIALTLVQDQGRFAEVQINSDKNITKFCYPAVSHGNGLINGGIYLMNRHVLKKYVDSMQLISLESQVFPRMLEAQTAIWGYESEARFIDMGLPQTYAELNTIFEGMVNT